MKATLKKKPFYLYIFPLYLLFDYLFTPTNMSYANAVKGQKNPSDQKISKPKRSDVLIQKRSDVLIRILLHNLFYDLDGKTFLISFMKSMMNF